MKYGGSVLEDGAAFRRAAEAMKTEHEKGARVVVVVSALKGATDRLLETAKGISSDTPRDVIDHIIGLGEEQSVRLMASALKSVGVDSSEVTPHSPGWPIVTDENYGDAEPVLEECEMGAELGIKPLIERGIVPVICGFVGRTLNGKVTTLGRGGSDTTAMLLARCLGADELVLVKDVGRVYTADPSRVEGVRPLESLRASEAHVLSSSGAKVLHSKVFRFKPDDLKIRIVSRDDSLNGNGTAITGNMSELEVEIHERPVTSITVLGNLTKDYKLLTRVLEGIEAACGSPLLFKVNGESTTLCVDGPTAATLQYVHSLVDQGDEAKAIASSEGLALIRLRGRVLEDAIEATGKLYDALKSEGIVLRDVNLGRSSLQFLVDWDQRVHAASLVEEAFKVNSE